VNFFYKCRLRREVLIYTLNKTSLPHIFMYDRRMLRAS